MTTRVNARWPQAALVVLVVGVIAAGLIGLAGPAYRFAGLGLDVAFGMIRYGTFAAFAAIALAVLWLIAGAVMRRLANWPFAVVALLLAGVAAYFPLSMRSQAQSVPPIHDISTDLVDPPAFVAVAPLRADAPNPVAYDTAQTEQQRTAYADIRPILLAADRQRVFDAALAVVTEKGWDLVEANAAEGRIEATHTSAWFGFKDDVVIRLKEMGPATRMDVRSKSRVGKSDLGANAQRIRDFSRSVQDRLAAK